MEFATDISPDLFVYGYRIDQLKAVKYLVSKYPGWLKSYHVLANHFEAMDVVAEELSGECDLTLHALPLWVGGGHIDYGVVFFDDSMTPGNRTPEDAENLEKLERLLESLDLSYTLKPKFEKLCSAACRKYPVEPLGMASRPAPQDAMDRDLGYEISIFVKGLREKHRDRKRKDGGVSQEGGSSSKQGTDTKPAPTKKRKRRVTPTPEGEEAGPSAAPTKKNVKKVKKVKKAKKVNKQDSNPELGDGTATALGPVMREDADDERAGNV